VAHDGRVVAAARSLEVREVDRVVHMAQCVGVAVADLDGVSIAKLALDGPRSADGAHDVMLRPDA